MGEVTIFREIFLVGEISKVLAVGWDFLLILKFFHKGLREGGKSISGGSSKRRRGFL